MEEERRHGQRRKKEIGLPAHITQDRRKAKKDRRKRKSIAKKRVIVPTFIATAVAIIGIYLFAMSTIYKTTDNSFIEGHVVSLAPKVSGQIIKLNVEDNQYVEEGYLIAQIDPKDYEVRLKQAKARLAEAKARLNVNDKRIEESMSNLEFAQKDFQRYSDMYKDGIVSKQDYDRSVNSLTNTQAQFDGAKNVKTSTEAEIQRLEAEVEAAKLDLSYTNIYAPQAGKVTGRSVEKGNYVQIAQPLMAISTDKMWVVANFKENQVTNMKEGQPVTIKLDTFPNKKFKGHVDSIQRSTGAKASLFPPENAVGSYVKIVQRVPVKIVFDEDYSNYNIVPGMSVVPSVKVK